MNQRIFSGVLAVIAILMTSGCATVLTPSGQTVKVTTHQGQTEVTGARCILKNDKGEWEVRSTPGTAKITKSYEDLVIRCNKENMEQGIHTVESRTRAVLGNVIVGGIVGMVTDAKTGKGYNYPGTMKVEMGKQTKE